MLYIFQYFAEKNVTLPFLVSNLSSFGHETDLSQQVLCLHVSEQIINHCCFAMIYGRYENAFM